MTPEQLRQKRCRILMELTDKGDEYDDDLFVTLNQLEELDAAYADSKRKPEVAFYTHLNTLDADMRAYVGTQGDVAAELRLIETIQKHLAARVGQLEKGPIETFAEGDKAIYGGVPVEITAVFKGDEYRIEWIDSDGEWMCVDTHVSHLASLGRGK